MYGAGARHLGASWHEIAKVQRWSAPFGGVTKKVTMFWCFVCQKLSLQENVDASGQLL